MPRIKNVKAVQKKSREHEVTALHDNVFAVKSGSSTKVYQVRMFREDGFEVCNCTCRWSQFRPRFNPASGCSHAVAVHNFRAQCQGYESVSAWQVDLPKVKQQHRSYASIGDGVVITKRA